MVALGSSKRGTVATRGLGRNRKTYKAHVVDVTTDLFKIWLEKLYHKFVFCSWESFEHLSENILNDNVFFHQLGQVEFALWDTAGQDEYEKLRALSYPDTDVILMCFSVDCRSSLENISEKWTLEVNQYCPEVPFILVGNKKVRGSKIQEPSINIYFYFT